MVNCVKCETWLFNGTDSSLPSFLSHALPECLIVLMMNGVVGLPTLEKFSSSFLVLWGRRGERKRSEATDSGITCLRNTLSFPNERSLNKARGRPAPPTIRGEASLDR